MSDSGSKPLVLITGAGGNIGRSLAASLAPSYRVVGLDRKVETADFPTIQADFSSADSIALALYRVRAEFGDRIASVIHLAAYFDFEDEFDRSPGAVVKDMMSGGVNLPWNLAAVGLIGMSLLFTRLTLGVEGQVANAHHVIGALLLTIVSVAAAEVARSARFLNVALGVALMAVPFVYTSTLWVTAATLTCGLLIALLSLRRGPVLSSYGSWNRFIV